MDTRLTALRFRSAGFLRTATVGILTCACAIGCGLNEPSNIAEENAGTNSSESTSANSGKDALVVESSYTVKTSTLDRVQAMSYSIEVPEGDSVALIEVDCAGQTWDSELAGLVEAEASLRAPLYAKVTAYISGGTVDDVRRVGKLLEVKGLSGINIAPNSYVVAASERRRDPMSIKVSDQLEAVAFSSPKFGEVEPKLPRINLIVSANCKHLAFQGVQAEALTIKARLELNSLSLLGSKGRTPMPHVSPVGSEALEISELGVNLLSSPENSDKGTEIPFAGSVRIKKLVFFGPLISDTAVRDMLANGLKLLVCAQSTLSDSSRILVNESGIEWRSPAEYFSGE